MWLVNRAGRFESLGLEQPSNKSKSEKDAVAVYWLKTL
jgi:hypothetical protein